MPPPPSPSAPIVTSSGGQYIGLIDLWTSLSFPYLTTPHKNSMRLHLPDIKCLLHSLWWAAGSHALSSHFPVTGSKFDLFMAAIHSFLRTGSTGILYRQIPLSLSLCWLQFTAQHFSGMVELLQNHYENNKFTTATNGVTQAPGPPEVDCLHVWRQLVALY